VNVKREINRLWGAVWDELIAAFHKQPHHLKSLAHSKSIDPRDLASAIIAKQLTKTHGIAFVQGNDRKRYAFRLVGLAILNEARAARRRGGPLEVPETIRDATPSPFDVLAAKREQQPRLRAVAIAVAPQRADFEALLAGSTYTDIAEKRGVSVSSVSRAMKKLARRVRFEMKQLPLFGAQDQRGSREEERGGAA